MMKLSDETFGIDKMNDRSFRVDANYSKQIEIAGGRHMGWKRFGSGLRDHPKCSPRDIKSR